MYEESVLYLGYVYIHNINNPLFVVDKGAGDNDVEALGSAVLLAKTFTALSLVRPVIKYIVITLIINKLFH